MDLLKPGGVLVYSTCTITISLMYGPLYGVDLLKPGGVLVYSTCTITKSSMYGVL